MDIFNIIPIQSVYFGIVCGNSKLYPPHQDDIKKGERKNYSFHFIKFLFEMI